MEPVGANETPPINEPVKEGPIVKPLNTTKSAPLLTIVLALLIVTAGIGTGYAIFQLNGPTGNNGGKTGIIAAPSDLSDIKIGQVYGDKDDKKFEEKPAEGVLLRGGINGEGTHHIERPGGKDQTVYVTSSVIDLDQFVNHKVQVRGDTFTAQQAGWLMDVGQLKVLELNVVTDAPAQTEAVNQE